MTTDQSSEAFEAQFKARYPTMSMKRTGKSGAYDDPGIQVEWVAFNRGWQAARQAEREAGRREGQFEEHEYSCSSAAGALRARRRPLPRTVSELLEVPFTRALTVLLTKDVPAAQAQADADLKAIEDGSQVFTHPTNEAYFHRLRLRIAEKPELAEKVAVFYIDEKGKLSEVKLSFEDELHWPVGFGNELWDEEAEISRVRRGHSKGGGEHER